MLEELKQKISEGWEGAKEQVWSNIIKIDANFFLYHQDQYHESPCAVGRVEKSKNGFGSYGYYFLNVFWYVENGGNFFLDIGNI